MKQSAHQISLQCYESPGGSRRGILNQSRFFRPGEAPEDAETLQKQQIHHQINSRHRYRDAAKLKSSFVMNQSKDGQKNKQTTDECLSTKQSSTPTVEMQTCLEGRRVSE